VKKREREKERGGKREEGGREGEAMGGQGALGLQRQARQKTRLR
jgi:hypothetical protein